MTSVLQELGTTGLIPVIKIEDASKAAGLARALHEGGLNCAEITFRTEAAAEAIQRIRKEAPSMIVGAGTVISIDQARQAAEAGAQFVVSPGFSASVVDWCIERNMPVIPGVNNPSHIQEALEKGLTVLKFFPAEASGGIAMLQAFAGPFPQVSFIPTGGISPENIGAYLRLPNVHSAGGSWMAGTDLIASEDWEKITGLSREAALAVQGFSFAHIGINQKNEAEALETSRLFSLFGFTPRDNRISWFNTNFIEVMNGPGEGGHGHIGIKCISIERSLAYLEKLGFHPVEETARRKNGKLSLVFLDREIGGFAVHLVLN
ncbi:bifunctional 4-hydroxy-2-oxoglutarate aldolase/2-dehydro-3-deoxy-phosphogluconate aldolase [Brucepastera parasyntrophica]|uniref:bifunctional 4-hydroxy-2-oxoglutarate aldolase/2-dehydro-3-deoxy-phosphogluconate aldolase n=1 Tax=Brucepastera parasyntrophica TaxID=2880008 RepID=UPI00210ACFB8|nr:bifunctional 4-hydroxy-2-oxoglutarate aldolase/2-dehydro-3-deoxy-phosphogluconate aldolase [Brucepastera parasyntrophica]ULQ60250.1 bifunctional 4-hydroxy-2-oxoglutarate aldolase/2-dehydro-3-deoxy-phosphogluconate aldolase [Brucepastera parasyntrophica]